MSYKPGDLDQRVVINTMGVSTPDGMGGFSAIAATQETVWAKVRPLGTREVKAGERVSGAANYMFVFRNRVIHETDTLEWDGVRYNVRGVLTRGTRNLYIEVMAERGVA